ncbi:HEAT repeat domain-containing protein [Kitasatospora sp. NPDC056531]|uniref:HEAT repeat domain-containing protein n=1 Tax=Kitasatospora sp. NPDC056531 TaxID=3345856 RepID=UPI003681BA57
MGGGPIGVCELARRWPDDPSVLPLLHDRAAHDRSPETRRRALEGLAALDADGPETVAPLTRTATDSGNSEMRSKAVNLLAERRSSHQATIHVLLDRLVQAPDDMLRLAALGHYAVIAPEAAETVIRARATGDPSTAVRRRALTMLAWQWPGRPETAATLEGVAAQDPDRYVREADAHLTSVTPGRANPPSS